MPFWTKWWRVASGAFVPPLWRIEVASGFHMAIRRERIDTDFCDRHAAFRIASGRSPVFRRVTRSPHIVYDTLDSPAIPHEMNANENGTPYYDRDKFKPELADDMRTGDMSATFTLKKNAVFQDGAPVTAKDVKWPLDCAVTVGGLPTFQMGAGSLTKPERFVDDDDRTIRVDFLRKDRLTIPDLAVIMPCVMNSEAVKKHATEKKP